MVVRAMEKKMTLREAFESKMMLLDGGMGSVIQTYGIKGANNDMLSIEKPDIILDIQRRYVDAGVDCLTTNTFSSQRVSQHEYHQEHRIAEMNRAAVKIAKQAAAEAMEKYGRQVYILGDVGPTSKMLSMSDDVNDPASRSITFDKLEDAYLEQIQVLVEEGVEQLAAGLLGRHLHCRSGDCGRGTGKGALDDRGGSLLASAVPKGVCAEGRLSGRAGLLVLWHGTFRADAGGLRKRVWNDIRALRDARLRADGRLHRRDDGAVRKVLELLRRR